jgi:hypothetical protein
MEQSIDGTLSGNDIFSSGHSSLAIFGGVIATLIVCLLGCCGFIYAQYFRRKGTVDGDDTMSPYEKWMRNDEIKKAGRVPRYRVETTPNPINLNKSEIHNLHNKVGTEGFEKKKAKGVWNPMNGTEPTGTISNIPAPERLDSNADITDLYGGRDSKYGGFNGNFMSAGGEGDTDGATMEAGDYNDIYRQSDHIPEGVDAMSTHNPMIDASADESAM